MSFAKAGDWFPRTHDAFVKDQNPPLTGEQIAQSCDIAWISTVENSGPQRWSVSFPQVSKTLLQLRVLRFGFLQDRDVGVGVFPEGEEVLVLRTGFGGVAGEGVSAGEA
jgi:hypothetical protein